MTILSIRDVWALEKATEVEVPADVMAAAEAALDAYDAGGHASLAQVARARELATGLVSKGLVERLARHFDVIEKGGDRGLPWELHGGDAGRRWALELTKARVEPDEEPEPERPEPVTDKHAAHRDLRRRLSLIMAAHGEDGVPIEHMRPHVLRHGHQAVALALRDLGADHVAGRVVATRKRAPATVAPKAKPSPKPKARAKPARVSKAIDATAPATWRPMRFRGSV